MLAATIAASGCSGDSDVSESLAEGSTGLASEIVALLPAGSAGNWPAGLDPATNTTSGLNLSLMNAIFGGLFQLTADDDGSNPLIVGVLASSYEITNEGRTLVIHLREGVLFSDGTPLDAEALQWNIERNIEAPCSCAPIRWPWAERDRVVVLDEHTVALNFSRPYGAAIHGLPVLNINWPASPTALAAMGEEAFKIRPVGAGPFVVVSNQLSSRLELERNPDYWQTGRPYLNRLVFQSIASEQAAYLALLAGDAQVVEGVTSTTIIDQALTEPKISVTRQPATAPYVIQLNTTTPPFDDKRAREAIYLATDVEAIRTGLFKGWYPVSQSFTGPGGLFHHERIPGYAEYDPERARAIVDEIDGLEVRLGTIQSFVAEQVVTALQTQWREAGIDTSIEMLELGALIGQLQTREWQALLQTAGSYDPESAAGVTLRFGSGQLFSGVANEALDRLFADAAAATDPQERDELYLEASKHISDNAYAPFLFAFSPTQLALAGVRGPGLTTRIPPIAINTGVFWQDVELSTE
jgi:peptide/nickel transport system substrate-binding protein